VNLSELCLEVSQLVSRGRAVIVCIAAPHVTTLQRLLEAGATDTVTYPIEAHALAKKIRRAQRRLGSDQ
jgi:DNA-binding response OmpR family regulator